MNASNDLRVLVVAPFGKDAALIESALRGPGISVSALPGPGELTTAILGGAGTAIITEEVLQNGAVEEVARVVRQQPPWSDFPFIVLTGGGVSTAATEIAARSVAPLGNVSLLERPLRPATLISAVRSALAARQRQYTSGNRSGRHCGRRRTSRGQQR
ncbi:MAG TPA: hypothetical protein VFB00_06585 [Terriglobales bacterium]|nr:hypothetical protein [Terriglobales bacterium]